MRVGLRRVVVLAAASAVGASALAGVSPASADSAQEQLLSSVAATGDQAQVGVVLRTRNVPVMGLPPYAGTVVLGDQSAGALVWQSDGEGELQAVSNGTESWLRKDSLVRWMGIFGKHGSAMMARTLDEVGMGDDEWFSSVVDIANAQMSDDEVIPGGDYDGLQGVFPYVYSVVSDASSVSVRKGSGGRLTFTVRNPDTKLTATVVTQNGLVTRYSERARNGLSFDVLGLGDQVVAPDVDALPLVDRQLQLGIDMYLSGATFLLWYTSDAADEAEGSAEGRRLTVADVRAAVENAVAGGGPFGEFVVTATKSSVRVRFAMTPLVEMGFPEPCVSMKPSRSKVVFSTCS